MVAMKDGFFLAATALSRSVFSKWSPMKVRYPAVTESMGPEKGPILEVAIIAEELTNLK